jgi:hypothetical protein
MSRRRGLWLSGVASAALFLVLVLIDRRIQESGGPGIVPFELAGSTDRATQILGQWGQAGQDAARLSLWLDFPYLVVYGAFFSLAVLALRDAARRLGWERFARAGAAIAVLPIVAAACDAIEDVGLLLVLDGHGASPAPTFATAFAVVKFAALATAQIYLLVGLAALARVRLRASRWSSRGPSA